MSIDVQQSPTGRVTIVRLYGEHDIATAYVIRRALAEVPDRADLLVVIDLARCTFLDSTVIGVLVSASKRIASWGSQLLVINTFGVPAKALGITGADKLLQSHAHEVLHDEELQALL